MADPGWYPDPAGAPGQYRYWDGRTWAPTTTANPSGGPGAPTPTPTPGPRRRTGLIIGISAALVVIIIAVYAGVRLLSSTTIENQPVQPSAPPASGPPTPASPPPTTDEPSAGPTEADPSTPSEPPTPPPTPSSTPTDCPVGSPTSRQDHPRDGRIHGGGLSFPKLKGYSQTQSQTGLSWAYDVDGQDKQIVEGWNSLYAVGAVSTADGFEEPRQASQLVLQCTLSSNLYENILSTKRLSSAKITVDGRPGWALRVQVRIDNPQVQVAGDIVSIIVVDTDSPESLAMFWACVPIDEPDDLAQLNSTIGKLRVEQ